MKCLAASCRKSSCDDCCDGALRGGCKGSFRSRKKKSDIKKRCPRLKISQGQLL